MKDTRKNIVKLTPGEAELLDIFWQHGPLTLSGVYEIYSGGTGVPRLQTIQTRLGRMVFKGLLKRNDVYPAIYSPTVSKSQTKGKYFDLIEELAGNDFAGLLLHLAEKRSLTPEEVDTLEQILAKNRDKEAGQ